MSEKVVVTGGFGLVGSQTLRRLVADGHRVVATDLGTAAQRKAAKTLPAGVEAHWADLTDPGQVDHLLAETSPTAIVHLAAVIPPDLEWVILRLAGVISVEPDAMPFSVDALFLQSALPTDGRIHTVDVRDVARAFAAATTADVAGETLLIAGDESHLLRQGEVGKALAAARGLVDALPGGRPGDPDSDENWFVTDWMETARAQQVLQFQHHAWPDMLAEMRAAAGWRRYPMRLISPLVRQFLKRRAAYRDTPGRYADPWDVIRAKLGEPRPDTPGRTSGH